MPWQYKNYYAILDIEHTASLSEIKRQYRLLAKEWHPDINKGPEATSKMQEIVKAYLILGDQETRVKYDIVYNIYFGQKSANEELKVNNHSDKEFVKATNLDTDKLLDDWIKRAKSQAREFTINSLKDTKGIIFNGLRYAGYSIGLILLLLIILIIYYKS